VPSVNALFDPVGLPGEGGKSVGNAQRHVQQMVWEMPATHIALEYGVSSKAIEKFCKKHQIQKPGRGYWAKLYAGKTLAEQHIG
jgi:hypothetical protein